MGHIRLARLPDASAPVIADFLKTNVEPGSPLLCDDWASYRPTFSELGAREHHQTAKITTLSRTGTRAHLIYPTFTDGVPLQTLAARSPSGDGARPTPMRLPWRVHLSFCPLTLSKPQPLSSCGSSAAWWRSGNQLLTNNWGGDGVSRWLSMGAAQPGSKLDATVKGAACG